MAGAFARYAGWMGYTHCQFCGYDLTGLTPTGECPECGKRYNMNAPYRQYRPDHPITRYYAAIAMGLLTFCIVACGGLFAAVARRPLPLIITTLLIASVTALGAFVYWWQAKEEGKDQEGQD